MTLWIVGGHDPTGGAGVSRDRWAAQAFAPGLRVETIVTADTEQGDGRPARSHPRAARHLARAFAGLPSPRAVKIGLVPAQLVDTVIAALVGLTCPIAVDPVLQASDGGPLGSTVAGVRRLAACARLVTPNLAEAAALTGAPPRDDDDFLRELGDAVAPAAVLLKGGHGRDPHVVRDRLHDCGEIVDFVRPRIPGDDPRGTGCALATAIACALAQGEPLRTACARAIAWLDDARTRTTIGPDGRPHLHS